MRDLTCFIVINIRFVRWNQFLNLKIVHEILFKKTNNLFDFNFIFRS